MYCFPAKNGSCSSFDQRDSRFLKEASVSFGGFVLGECYKLQGKQVATLTIAGLFNLPCSASLMTALSSDLGVL
jgi:hypothetical protein